MWPLRTTSIRFGAFELNADQGRLSRNGETLPVRGLPIQILCMLVEADGRVVTRARFKELLWPGSGRIDTERRLNTAVRALRETLDESAESPRYIETVRGAGYRWCYSPPRFEWPRMVAAAAIAILSVSWLALPYALQKAGLSTSPPRKESVRLVVEPGQDTELLSRELARILNQSIESGEDVEFRTRVRIAGEDTTR